MYAIPSNFYAKQVDRYLKGERIAEFVVISDALR